MPQPHDIHDVWTVDWPANTTRRYWHFDSELAAHAFIAGVDDWTDIQHSPLHTVTQARDLAAGHHLKDLLA